MKHQILPREGNSMSYECSCGMTGNFEEVCAHIDSIPLVTEPLKSAPAVVGARVPNEVNTFSHQKQGGQVDEIVSRIEQRCKCKTPLMLINGIGQNWTVDEQPYNSSEYEETEFGDDFIDEHIFGVIHLIGKFCPKCNKIYDVEHTM